MNSSEQICNYTLDAACEAGYLKDQQIPSFSELKQFVEERKYKINFESEHNVRLEFETYDDLFKIISKRT